MPKLISKSTMELRTKKIIKCGQREKMYACKKCEGFPEGKGHMGLREFILL